MSTLQRLKADKYRSKHHPVSTDTIKSTPKTQPLVHAMDASDSQSDILVAGSLASDTSFDFRPTGGSSTVLEPTLRTSNPAKVSQSAGGVGRNVATAAHLAGARVALASAVADDISGEALLSQLNASGMPTSFVKRLKTASGASTAQYTAINNAKKDLAIAVADMSILDRPEFASSEYWQRCIEQAKPKWVVVDGNWSPKTMSTILTEVKTKQLPAAFEPVSTAKAVRLFDKTSPSIKHASCLPHHIVSLASPNAMELEAIHSAAREGGHFESEHWWRTIDSFGIPSAGASDRLAAATSSDLVNQGIPQQAVQLLPYIPNIVTKLGPRGCLLTQVLRPGDERLTGPESAPFVVSRNVDSHLVAGVYMRLFPSASVVPESEIVSVNGIGDTMLGVIMAGLVKHMTLEQVLPVAQEAAVLSLRSKEAVSPDVSKIARLLN